MTQASNFRFLLESDKGTVSGLARLDAQGDVVDAAGVKVKGSGTVSSTAIADSTTVGRQLVTATDATAARGVIGAVALGTTATTAKAGNYVPAWTEVTGKPTTFTPATHTHTAANITDLADVLRGTDCVIMYTGTQPLRTTGTTDTARRVRWVSATAPSIAAGYAIDGLDVWERTV